ncbi:MAG TPA: hypothetical protein VFM90_05730, partial [Cyclobacteriaceae bacterium]|nr:hypothetical protein [Cyclobacteriaceae bacterium]
MLKDFRSRVILRIIFLALTLSLAIFMMSRTNMLFAAILTCVIVVFQVGELFHFVSLTNRKLTRFLE